MKTPDLNGLFLIHFQSTILLAHFGHGNPLTNFNGFFVNRNLNHDLVKQGEEERTQRNLLVVLTCGCTVLCWVETFCAEFQTCQTVRFCQHALSLLTVSWLGQAGVLSLLQVS